LKPELLELLCCPECHRALQPKNIVTREGRWYAGELDCGCGKSYPITDFIPRFVRDDSYASSFSFEWTVHAATQIDSESSRRSWDTFFEKTGFKKEDLRGRRILDVGVGSGRFADVASQCGADVVGVDLSFAVDAARQTFDNRQNITFVQADVFQLPFRPRSFDFIYSIGVLHHTPDCHAAFQALPKLLINGGTIAIWVYPIDLRPPSMDGVKLPWKQQLRLAGHRCAMAASDTYRLLTTRLNKRLLYFLCHAAVPYGPLLRIPVIGHALKVISPVSYERKPAWRVLDTFDWYSPQYQSKHTYAEVMQWFSEANLVDVRAIERWPVAVHGTMPNLNGGKQ